MLALGSREAFDAVLASYRARVPEAPEPLWCMAALPPSSDAIQLTGVLREAELAAVVPEARARRVVVLDFSEVVRVDFVAAPAFCSALRFMVLQNKRVIIANIAELHSQLLRTIGLHPDVAVLSRRVTDEASTAAAARPSPAPGDIRADTPPEGSIHASRRAEALSASG